PFDCERQRSRDGTACTSVAKSRRTSNTGNANNLARLRGFYPTDAWVHHLIRSAPQAFSVTFQSREPVSPGYRFVRGKCPQWVISRHFTEFVGCPLYPQKRTSAERIEMSVKGHVWTAPGWQGESSLCSIGRCSHVFGLFARYA